MDVQLCRWSQSSRHLEVGVEDKNMPLPLTTIAIGEILKQKGLYEDGEEGLCRSL